MAFAPVSSLTVDGLNKFLSMTYHQFINQAVYTFAELGVADQLIHAAPDRGLTVEEIINDYDRKQWNTQLLYRILRACVYAGIVKLVNDDKHFILTSSGIMMTSSHPSRIRDRVRFIFGPFRNGTYQQLPNIVRNEGTGSGVARVSGGLDLYGLMSQPDQKELLSIFSGSMTSLLLQAGDRLVLGVDFSRFQTIGDVGGNRGTFLAQILQNYPTIQHGFVLDLPHIIKQYEYGEDFTSHEISKDRWSFIVGDMYEPTTIPVADAYLLKYILHNYNDEKCLQILSSIRQANEHKKDSLTTIFIVENIILLDGDLSNWQSYGMDIAMAALFENARERTEDEYKELLQKSGFQFKKLYPLQTPLSIIEGILASK